MDVPINLKYKFQIWLTPEDPDEPMEDAVARAKALGNTILEVDYNNRKILILKENPNG